MPLVLGVLADVPVLLGHAGLSGVHTGLTSLHVAENLNGIQVAALVGVNPVFSWVGKGKMASGDVWDDGPSGLSPITAGAGGTAGPALTALPVGVAHLEVTAGAGGVLAAAFRAPDVLDLLAQALEGGVHLEVTVTDHIGIISPVVAATIVSLLLRWLGQEA